MNQSNDTEQFGIHLMVDGYGAPKEILTNKDRLKEMLQEIPASLGMHLISEPLVVEVGPKNRKDPGGLSGFVMIAESHLSFHTFPERGFVTIDLYTCQNSMDTEMLLLKFKDAFQYTDADTFVQPRGVRYPTNNIH